MVTSAKAMVKWFDTVIMVVNVYLMRLLHYFQKNVGLQSKQKRYRCPPVGRRIEEWLVDHSLSIFSSSFCALLSELVQVV